MSVALVATLFFTSFMFLFHANIKTLCVFKHHTNPFFFISYGDSITDTFISRKWTSSFSKACILTVKSHLLSTIMINNISEHDFHAVFSSGTVGSTPGRLCSQSNNMNWPVEQEAERESPKGSVHWAQREIHNSIQLILHTFQRWRYPPMPK